MLYNNTTGCRYLCDKGKKCCNIKLTAKEVQDTILKWAGDVTSAKSANVGDYIASTYFAPNAILRGTVSAITRKQTGGMNNVGMNPTPDVTQPNHNIAAYFDYFNSYSLQGLRVDNNPFDSSSVHYQLNDNIVQYFVYVYLKQDNAPDSIATMVFTVKKFSDGSIKFLSLQSSPQYQTPPAQLEESVNTLP